LNRETKIIVKELKKFLKDFEAGNTEGYKMIQFENEVKK